jgi:hypothetical protein
MGETCSLFCFLSQSIVGINFGWDAEKIEIFRPSLTGKKRSCPNGGKGIHFQRSPFKAKKPQRYLTFWGTRSVYRLEQNY